jgi:hypothetical protein
MQIAVMAFGTGRDSAPVRGAGRAPIRRRPSASRLAVWKAGFLSTSGTAPFVIVHNGEAHPEAQEQKSGEGSIMGAQKSFTVIRVATWIVISTLSTTGYCNMAAAQEGQKLFIEGDIVRGNTPAGITGPVCVLTNQFKRKEKIVFRIRVRDVAGASLDDKALKSIAVELSDGQKFAAEYRARPPLAVRKALGFSEPTDYFWSAVWLIPEHYPTGSLSYKVVATDMQGNTQSWTPFKDPRSLPVVMAGDVEYTK